VPLYEEAEHYVVPKYRSATAGYEEGKTLYKDLNFGLDMDSR
jgi:hypothetical protein